MSKRISQDTFKAFEKNSLQSSRAKNTCFYFESRSNTERRIGGRDRMKETMSIRKILQDLNQSQNIMTQSEEHRIKGGL